VRIERAGGATPPSPRKDSDLRSRGNTGEERAPRVHQQRESNVSRAVVRRPRFEFCAWQKNGTNSRRNPDRTAPLGPTYPQAGVIKTSPAHRNGANSRDHARFTHERICEHGPCERGNAVAKCGGGGTVVNAVPRFHQAARHDPPLKPSILTRAKPFPPMHSTSVRRH